MSSTKSSARPSLLRAGIVTGAVTAALIAGTGVPAFAAVPMTLSSASGPSGGGNSLTGTAVASTAVPAPFPANVTPIVQFQFIGTGTAANCATTYRTPAQITANSTTPFATTAGVVDVDPATVKRISSTKIAFTVPSGAVPAFTDAPANTTPNTVNTNGLALVGSQTTARYNVCVYDSKLGSGTLLTNAAYTIATRPTITSMDPLGSPTLGGGTITVNGTGFATTGTTATIGGVALTNIRVAAAGTSFTATVPARAAGINLPVIVTTAGGQVSSGDPDNNPATNDAPIYFTYSNGVNVAPNTAPSGTAVDVSVQGVGFQQLRFNNSVTDVATSTSTTSQVFLVSGAYAKATNRGVKQCTGVLVISDTELICTLDFRSNALELDDSDVGAALVPEGAYTLTVVGNGSATAANDAVQASNVSSGATFTVAQY